MSKKDITFFEITTIFVVLALCLTGCVAAKSDQDVAQTPTQVTPTKAENDQATQGAMVTVTQHNNLDGNVPRNKGTTSQPAYDAEDVAMAGEKTRMGFKGAHGDTWNIQFVDARIGGTDVGGTSTATGTSTQTPGQNTTQDQRTEPKTSASIPITNAMPGGSESGNASTALEGTSTANKSDKIDQQYTQLLSSQKSMADNIAALAELMRIQALNRQPPTSQPVIEMVPVVPVFAPPAGTP